MLNVVVCCYHFGVRRVGLPEKAPKREACDGDSRHFCRHAADQVLGGLSPASPLSPTKLQPCSSTTKLMRYRSPSGRAPIRYQGKQ